MNRALIFLIASLIVPGFMGSNCPCAHAFSGPDISILKTDCHGCCPEMNSSGNCQMEIENRSKAVLISGFNKVVLTVLKALSPRESRDIAINRPAYARAGDEPLFISEKNPLYLSLNVLRI